MTIPHVPYRWRPTSAEFNLMIDQINAETTPPLGKVATAESTTSTTYVDLPTLGPVVTLTTGTSVEAIVIVSARRTLGTGNAITAVAVSGATTIVAPAGNGTDGTTGSNVMSNSNTTVTPLVRALVITGLTPGTNSFRIQYRTSAGGTHEFSNRLLMVRRID